MQKSRKTRRKSKKNSGKLDVFRSFGGDKRDRTADLLNAIGFGSDFMQFDE